MHSPRLLFSDVDVHCCRRRTPDLRGLVTRTDLLEAIVGGLPDIGNAAPQVQELDNNSLPLEGSMPVYETQQRLHLSWRPKGHLTTLAGFISPCLAGNVLV